MFVSDKKLFREVLSKLDKNHKTMQSTRFNSEVSFDSYFFNFENRLLLEDKLSTT